MLFDRSRASVMRMQPVTSTVLSAICIPPSSQLSRTEAIADALLVAHGGVFMLVLVMEKFQAVPILPHGGGPPSLGTRAMRIYAFAAAAAYFMATCERARSSSQNRTHIAAVDIPDACYARAVASALDAIWLNDPRRLFAFMDGAARAWADSLEDVRAPDGATPIIDAAIQVFYGACVPARMRLWPRGWDDPRAVRLVHDVWVRLGRTANAGRLLAALQEEAAIRGRVPNARMPNAFDAQCMLNCLHGGGRP